MFRKLNSLIPPFLKSIDKYLLLNRPGLWATRIHYVLFFVLVFGGLLMVHAIVRPIDLADVPSPESYFKFLLIPSVLALGIWAYQVSKFQVEKGFGQKKIGNRLRDQLVYAIVISLLVAIPYLYGEILSYKISNSISDEELVEDVNALNRGIFILTRKHSEAPFIHVIYLNEKKQTINIDQIDEEFSEELNHVSYVSQSMAACSATMTKYSSFDPNEEVLNDLIPDRRGSYFSDVNVNMSIIEESKNHNNAFQQESFFTQILPLLLLIWMGIQSFLFSGWKRLFLAGLLGISILFGLVLTIVLLSEMNIYFNNDAVLLLVSIGFFIFFLFHAYGKTYAASFDNWKIISLNIAAFMTPYLLGLFDAELIVVMVVIVWNLLYYPRFAQLQTIPKDN